MRLPDRTDPAVCYFRAAEGIGLLILGTVSLILAFYLKKTRS
jgi:hypothetical protein